VSATAQTRAVRRTPPVYDTGESVIKQRWDGVKRPSSLQAKLQNRVRDRHASPTDSYRHSARTYGHHRRQRQRTGPHVKTRHIRTESTRSIHRPITCSSRVTPLTDEENTTQTASVRRHRSCGPFAGQRRASHGFPNATSRRTASTGVTPAAMAGLVGDLGDVASPRPEQPPILMPQRLRPQVEHPDHELAELHPLLREAAHHGLPTTPERPARAPRARPQRVQAGENGPNRDVSRS
jgi:hypothetical protein